MGDNIFHEDVQCGAASVRSGSVEAGRAILGLFGLQGLVANSDEVDAEKDLDNARNDFNKIASQWNNAIEKQKHNIVQSQLKYLKEQIVYSETTTSIVTETLAEKIENHNILIALLIVLVIFLILYDIL